MKINWRNNPLLKSLFGLFFIIALGRIISYIIIFFWSSFLVALLSTGIVFIGFIPLFFGVVFSLVRFKKLDKADKVFLILAVIIFIAELFSLGFLR